MRVALACPYAWDDPGGVQVHVRELGGWLLEVGHEVLVLAPLRHRATDPWVRRVGQPVDVTFNSSNAPIDPRPWSIRNVRDALDRFGPDVVHVHEPFAPSTGMWATLASRAPVIATFHSGVERSRLYDLAAPALRRMAGRLTVRIAVSRAARRSAARRIGGQFEIVPNGVDVDRFQDASPADLGEGRKLLFVGRLDERKGFPIAVAAFERIALDHDDVRLVVVGDGPERSSVDALSRALRDRVTMLGPIPNAELHPVHAACDLFLSTAVGGESFGYVLVEAMAAGLPVVASDIPGYDEVVTDGAECLLVPPRDPVAAAAAASRILDDPGLAERLSSSGRARAQVFDWGTVGARIVSLYERALGAGPLR